MQTTFAQNLLDLTLDKGALEASATKNGMTASQMAVARYIQSIAKQLTPEALAIMGNKSEALAAMDRVGNLPVTTDSAVIITAILNK